MMTGGCFLWPENIPPAVRQGKALYDVLIIGSGGGGMRAALEASKTPGLKVAVMTKMAPTRSATTMAQGGINGAARTTDSKDSPEVHAFDTVKGADYLCDQDAVEYFTEKAPEILFEVAERHYVSIFSRFCIRRDSAILMAVDCHFEFFHIFKWRSSAKSHKSVIIKLR